MKKVGLMAAAMLFAAATFAQTTPSSATSTQTEPPVAQAKRTNITPGENAQMKKLDSCIRNYNSEKATAKRAMVRGEFKASNADYARADTDKKYIKAMAAQLKNEGVRHPIRLAHKEIKRTDNKLIIADIMTIKADKLAKKKALSTGDSTTVKVAESNLIADKNTLKKDIKDASHDEPKRFTFVRSKS